MKQIIHADLTTVRSSRRPPSNPPSIGEGITVSKIVAFSGVTNASGIYSLSQPVLVSQIKSKLLGVGDTIDVPFTYSVLKATFWGLAGTGAQALEVTNSFDGRKAMDWGSYTSRPVVELSNPARQQTDMHYSETGLTLYSIAHSANSNVVCHITVLLRLNTNSGAANFAQSSRDDVVRSVIDALLDKRKDSGDDDAEMREVPKSRNVRQRLSNAFGAAKA